MYREKNIGLCSKSSTEYYGQVDCSWCVWDGAICLSTTILTVGWALLAQNRLHGYGVIRSVLELSDGRVRLRPGTVYGGFGPVGRRGFGRLRWGGVRGGPVAGGLSG